MNALVLCLECNRHARPGEPACPFCGGELGPEPPPLRLRLKNATRAMIFYGAVVLAAPGCAEPEPELQTAAPTGPPMEPVERAGPMQPVEVATAEPEGFTGEVEAAPVEEDDAQAAAERADAERRKRRARGPGITGGGNNTLGNGGGGGIPDPFIRHAMPYGAPPFDFEVV